MKKSVISILLVFIIMLTAVPASVFASDKDTAGIGAALTAKITPEHNYAEKSGSFYITTYTVHASGGKAPYTYEWEQFTDNKWSTAYAYTETYVAYNTGKRRCKVTDDNGISVYSNESDAIRKIEIKTQPVSGLLKKYGSQYQYTMHVEAQYGVAPYTYKWLKNGRESYPVGTSKDYTATSDGAYSVMVFDSNGEMAISKEVSVEYEGTSTVTDLSMPDAYWFGKKVKWKPVDGENAYDFEIRSRVPDGYHSSVLMYHGRITRDSYDVKGASTYRYSGNYAGFLSASYSDSEGFTLDVSPIITAADDNYSFTLTAEKYSDANYTKRTSVSRTFRSITRSGEQQSYSFKIGTVQRVDIYVHPPVDGQKASYTFTANGANLTLTTDKTVNNAGLIIRDPDSNNPYPADFYCEKGKTYRYYFEFNNKTVNGVDYYPAGVTEFYINGVLAETFDPAIDKLRNSGKMRVWADLECSARDHYEVTIDPNGGSGDMGFYPVKIGSSFTLPACYLTAPSGKGFKCWEDENGNQYVPGKSITITRDTVIKAVWETIQTGYKVSGTVTSFLSDTDEVSIVFRKGSMIKSYGSATVTGNSASYQIDNVDAGIYTVFVSKNNHVTLRQRVTVSAAKTLNLKIHPIGDINGDGEVTTLDYAQANAHAKGAKLLTGYAFECGDVVGEEAEITSLDAARINAHAKGAKLLW